MAEKAISHSLTSRQLPALSLAVAGVVGAGFAMSGILKRVADLYPDVLPPRPYLVPDHAFLLYVATPLAMVAVVGMLLVPGFLLALVLGGARRFGLLLATAFGGALLLRILVHAALKLSGVVALETPAFALTEVGLDVALLGLLAHRLRGGRSAVFPAEREDRRRALWTFAIIMLTIMLLLPVLFWQDLTDDGLEALEIGRSLATHIIPRFPSPESGLMGLGIGMQTMAYPIGWFVALIGPVEAAARLPLTIYLPILFAIVTDLIEYRSSRRLGVLAEGAIVLALAAYVVTMAFSASYTPYSADASAPAAFETLTVLCIAATILFMWEGRTTWMLAFAVLAYFARPTGLLALGLLAVATVTLGPAERRAQRVRLGIAITLCLAAALLYEKVYVPLAADGLGVGYPSDSILNRLRYLIFTDVKRLLILAVPGGLLPALTLLAWRRQDPLARQLTVFCVLYFLFFYPQAFVALHHFVPVMILPVVVFWRVALASDARWPAGAALLAAAVSVMVSLPRSFAVDRSSRAIGKVTDARVGDLNGDWPAHREALRARHGVTALFRSQWEVADPALERVATPLGVIYYASRPRPATDTVNYVIQLEGASPPAGFSAVGARRGVAVFVRDTARWRRDRENPPRTDYRAALYDIPRSTLFATIGIRAHAYQLDVGRLPGLWRLYDR